jgi:hypothetical protein
MICHSSLIYRSSSHQFASQHRHRLPEQMHASRRRLDDDAHLAAAPRCLETQERALAEARGPIGAEGAVGTAGHRVLVDAVRRREEARDEIVGRRVRPRRHGDAHLGRCAGEGAHVGTQCAHLGFGGDLDEVAGLIGRRRHGTGAERRADGIGHAGAARRASRKVHPDPVAVAPGAELAARRVKTHRLVGARRFRLPQRVRAGERGVAAQRDLHRRREPAQREAVVAPPEEGRLARFISAATACSHAASRGGSSRQTAAGLPAYGTAVKESTWMRRSDMLVPIARPCVVRKALCRRRFDEYRRRRDAQRRRYGLRPWIPICNSRPGEHASSACSSRRR